MEEKISIHSNILVKPAKPLIAGNVAADHTKIPVGKESIQKQLSSLKNVYKLVPANLPKTSIQQQNKNLICVKVNPAADDVTIGNVTHPIPLKLPISMQKSLPKSITVIQNKIGNEEKDSKQTIKIPFDIAKDLMKGSSTLPLVTKFNKPEQKLESSTFTNVPINTIANKFITQPKQISHQQFTRLIQNSVKSTSNITEISKLYKTITSTSQSKIVCTPSIISPSISINEKLKLSSSNISSTYTEKPSTSKIATTSKPKTVIKPTNAIKSVIENPKNSPILLKRDRILQNGKIIKMSEIANSDSMINVQISNGVLSDPHGPIKLLKMIKPNKNKKQRTLMKRNLNLKSNLKLKQQISKNSEIKVLKHKKLIDLQSNVRGRSKSFTNEVGAKKSEKISERRLSEPVAPETKNIKQVENNPLYCNENLDSVSEVDKSTEASKSDSISSSSIVSVPDSDIEKKVGNQNLSESASNESNTIKPIDISKTLTETELVNMSELEDDSSDNIIWNNGIGYLNDSDLHFQFNEYGLIEMIDDDAFKNLVKQEEKKSQIKPLNERPQYEIKDRSKQILSLNEAIYKCLHCLSYGIAKEFETPDFCSENCHKMYVVESEKKVESNLQIPSPVKTPLKKLAKSSSKDSSENEEKYRKEKIILPKRKRFGRLTHNEFNWDRYLAAKPGLPASKRLFNNPFPSSFLPNRFLTGQKLEAIDPENSSIISVATIVKTCGYRVKISFDGYPIAYDFWTNADSLDLLPAGFCRKTLRTLRTPPNYKKQPFVWEQYLTDTKSQAVARGCFQVNYLMSYVNPFKIGMKIEADDLRNSEKVCVATIKDVIATRMLIHFDGWDDMYDYWATITSPYIHPVNWHKENGFTLTVPPGKLNFSWSSYLEETKSIPAPRTLFYNRKPMEFKVGMKLEAVDKRVSTLIRPATIVAIDEYEIKIHFDGWPEHYAMWYKDDSPDIHPIKWCSKSGHPIEFPPDYEIHKRYPCGTLGCRGIGNAVYMDESYHKTPSECPYERKNYFKIRKIANRLEYYTKRFELKSSPQKILPIKRKSEPTISHPKKLKIENTETYKWKRELPIAVIDMNKLKREESSNSRTPSPPPPTSLPPSLDNSNEVTEIQKRINVSKTLLVDYGPRLEYVHKLWQKNTQLVKRNSEFKKNSDNPMNWDLETVANCIKSLPNCLNLGHLFIENEIDGVAFLSMNQKDLKENLKLKLGPSVVIYNEIIYLREEYTLKFLE